MNMRVEDSKFKMKLRMQDLPDGKIKPSDKPFRNKKSSEEKPKAQDQNTPAIKDHPKHDKDLSFDLDPIKNFNEKNYLNKIVRPVNFLQIPIQPPVSQADEKSEDKRKNLSNMQTIGSSLNRHVDRPIIFEDRVHDALISLSARKGLFRGGQLKYYFGQKYDFPVTRLHPATLRDGNLRKHHMMHFNNYLSDVFTNKKLAKLDARLDNLRQSAKGQQFTLRYDTVESILDKNKVELSLVNKARNFINEQVFLNSKGKNRYALSDRENLRFSDIKITDNKLIIEGYKSRNSNPNLHTYAVDLDKLKSADKLDDFKKIIDNPKFDPRLAAGEEYKAFQFLEKEKQLHTPIKKVYLHARTTNALLRSWAFLGTGLSISNIGVGAYLDAYDERFEKGNNIKPEDQQFLKWGRRTTGNVPAFLGGFTGSLLAVSTKWGRSYRGRWMTKEALKAPSYTFSASTARAMPQNALFGNFIAFGLRFAGITAYDEWKRRQNPNYKNWDLSDRDREVIGRDFTYSFIEYGAGAVYGGALASKIGAKFGGLLGGIKAGRGRAIGAAAGSGIGYIMGTLVAPKLMQYATHPALDWIYKKNMQAPDYIAYNPDDMGRTDLNRTTISKLESSTTGIPLNVSLQKQRSTL